MGTIEAGIESVFFQKRFVGGTLIDAMGRAGWEIEKPKATMFVWAKIPEPFQKMGSLEFTKLLLKEAKVAVSPGVGFGLKGSAISPDRK